MSIFNLKKAPKEEKKTLEEKPKELPKKKEKPKKEVTDEAVKQVMYFTLGLLGIIGVFILSAVLKLPSIITFSILTVLLFPLANNKLYGGSLFPYNVLFGVAKKIFPSLSIVSVKDKNKIKKATEEYKEAKKSKNPEKIKKAKEKLEKVKLDEQAKDDEVKRIIAKEKKYVKAMGKAQIASYDEQQEKVEKKLKKFINFKWILLIMLILFTMLFSFIFILMRLSPTNDEIFIRQNSIIDFEMSDKVKEIADKQNSQISKILGYKIPTEENTLFLQNLLDFHIKNSKFYVFIKGKKEPIPVKGLNETIAYQEKAIDKLNANYQEYKTKLDKLEWKSDRNEELYNRLSTIVERLDTELGEYQGYKELLEKQLTNYDKLKITIAERINKWNFGKSFVWWWSIFAFWLYILGGLIMKSIIDKEKELTTHGNAKWATLEDMPKGKPSVATFGTDLLVTKGVVLGKFDGHTLRDDSKTHLLVSAPTRTGKGVSIIIPTLIDSWDESVFVLDIKGENYQLTSGFRKERFNNKIIRLAPMSSESSKYNPMNEIDVAFLGGLKESEDIDRIAGLLAQSEGGKADPFWDENGSIFIQALMTFALYRIRQDGIEMKQRWKADNHTPSNEEIKEANRIASFSDIADILTNPDMDASYDMKEYFQFLAGMTGNKNPNGKDLYGAKAIKPQTDANGKKVWGEPIEENYIKHFDPTDHINDDLKRILTNIYPTNRNLINRGIHPNIQKLFAKIATMSENMFGSVKAVGETKLKVFSTPIVRYNTSESDFRIWDLMNYKTPISLYLVIEPKDLEAMSAFARILLIQIVNKLTSEMDYISGGGHKWRLLFILDEFPAIGKMSVLEKAIGFVAGYGMKLVIILQSLDQLYNIYTEKNGFMSNCQIQVFYTANENQSAEYISKTFGSETIQYETKSGKKALSLGQAGEARQGRNLLGVSDVRSLPLDKILIVAGGKPPILTEKIQYFIVPEYKGRTKIPYIISEGLDVIADNVNIENETSYKLINPDENDILKRYEVFYAPKNITYGVESTMYRYFKVCYVLGYMKQPLIFARYFAKGTGKDTVYSAKGFVGDLLNNFNFKDKDIKETVLKRARISVVAREEDLFKTINMEYNISERDNLFYDSLMGYGVFKDKKFAKKGLGDTEHLFNYSNKTLYEETKSLNDNVINENGRPFTNKILPVNSTIILDLEKTDKDRAETVFYGSLLYDGVLESILKVNSVNVATDSSKQVAENKTAIADNILKSKTQFIEFLFSDVLANVELTDVEKEGLTPDEELEVKLSKVYKKNQVEEIYNFTNSYLKENFNLGIDPNKDLSLKEIFESRKEKLRNKLARDNKLKLTKLADFTENLKDLYDEVIQIGKDNKISSTATYNIDFEDEMFVVSEKSIYDEYLKLTEKYGNYNKILEIMTDNFIKDNLKKDDEVILDEMTKKSVVYILSTFNVVDPLTQRKIEHKIYVPIPLKVVLLPEDEDLSAQQKANVIMRNFVHFIRNNNATWDNLQEDLRSSIVSWNEMTRETQLRKGSLKSMLKK